MITVREFARLTLATLLTVSIFAACGGSEEPAPAPAKPPAAKQPAPQTPKAKPMAKPTAKKPTQPAAPKQAEVREVDPKTYKRDVMELPSDFPSYPDAREKTEIYQTVGSSRARRFETTDTPDAVHEHYLDAFSSGGWRIDNDAVLGDMRMMIVSKGAKKGSVMIAPTADGGSDLTVTGVDE